MATNWLPARFTEALRCLLASLCCLVAVAPAPAAARADETTFIEALYKTKIGPDDLQAARARVLLRELKLARQADALALELAHRYADRLNGVPPEQGLTLGALIEAGQSRPPPSAAWLARLQEGVVLSLAFEWPKADVPAPGALDAYLRVRESMAPGVWRVPFDVPRIYLAFDLLNRSSLPVPMLDFSMALPDEAGAPRYECKFERSRNASSQRAVDPLWPGERDTALCSSAVSQPEEGAVLAAISTMRATGQAPQLRLAVSADDAARQVREAALSRYARLDPAWSSAQRLAAREPGQKWLVSDQPMEAPRPVLTLAQRWTSAGQALAGLMSVTVASLMLFVLGRTLQRLGVPLPVVVGVTIVLSVAAASVLAMVVAGPDPTAGDGWQRGATIGLAAGAGVGFILFGALMLHLLHRRLDADNISWLDAVVSGWRNAFRLNGTATGGEFWGFYAHCLWLLVAVRMALRPWDAPVCVLIIVAMMTIAKRRLAAFRPIEQIAIVAVPLLYVVVVILDR